MAFGSVTLVPGVNVERTPTLLRAGIAVSSLIRFRDSLVQKLGGWLQLYPFAISGVPRDLHAWEDLNGNDHLAIGTTGTGSKLVVITDGNLQDITPQTLISNFAPNFSTTASSPTVNVVDPNISNVTVDDTVFFNVPISIGGLLLFGLYPITQITGTHSYNITAASNATTTETNPTATNGTTAIGNNTLHFGTTPSWLVDGMVIANLTNPSSIPPSTVVTASTGTTVTMNNNAAAPGVGNGDQIVFCSLPVFTTTNGSQTVAVAFINHGLSIGSTVVFQIPTTGEGVTIGGAYEVSSVTDVNNFAIAATTLATGTGTFAMNAGAAELVYYIALGPPPAGTGFGLGGFGSGGFGTGTTTSGSQTGTPITATDWTSDNWGEILIACPENGPIYYWDPESGFQNAQVIASGPAFNEGIFISTTEQILIAYGSSVSEQNPGGVGVQQQPLLVQWSDAGNFFQWDPDAADQAGNFPIPTGSRLVAGMAVSNQNLLWTDLDLWAMNYIGVPDVFGFNKIGAGLGAVSSHAVQQLRGSVFWMAPSNFASYTSNGANVIPCPVWDAVFQNINTSFLQNVRAMPNTPYNEVGWLYPSAASSSGECDSYVKMNITEPGAPWDIGPMNRSAWTDESVLGMPIGAASNGLIYQHEVSPDAAGSPLVASFTTGFFYLQESEDYTFVDQIIPDFKWSTFTGGPSAQIQMTFNVVNFPGDTPISYGPYTVTQATEFLSVRFRGRMLSITITSSDIGSFWRIGSIKYRYEPAGRR